jgi:hypothetical protein
MACRNEVLLLDERVKKSWKDTFHVRAIVLKLQGYGEQLHDCIWPLNVSFVEVFHGLETQP